MAEEQTNPETTSAADDIESGMDPEAAVESAQAAAGAVSNRTQEPQPLNLPDFHSNGLAEDSSAISLLGDVNLHVKVELGRTRMFVEDVLRLNEGAVVELDKPAGDPVDIYVNNRHVARGEVLVVNDNFCVRISEIIQHDDLEE